MVFVLGAGASSPYGFPLGFDLRQKILGVSIPPESALHRSDFEPFRKELAQSGTESVDAFLESESGREFDKVGRLAIAETLIGYEQHNRLFLDACTDHWYSYLFNRLFDGMQSVKQLFTLRLAFITFNYDRSLEYYLTTVLAGRFKATEAEIARVFSHIKVIHVHGDLGPLPQLKAKSPLCREYTPLIMQELVELAADRIKVVHQASDSSGEFDEARALLQTADSIYLMGFGYHLTNMRRLRLPLDKRNGTTMYMDQIAGTAFNLTHVEVKHYQRLYNGLELGHPALMNRDFLRHNDEFLRSVSEINDYSARSQV